MNRRTFLLGAASGLVATVQPPALQAQNQPGVIMVGVLGGAPTGSPKNPLAAPFVPSATKELEADIGAVLRASAGSYVHFVHGVGPDVKSLTTQALDLVRLNVKVIVAVGTPAAVAAANATKALPIVMVGVADPVALGLVRTLARPGGNISGVSLLGPEILEKSMDLLKEAAPRIQRPAVLWNPLNPGAALSLQQLQRAGASKGLNFVSVPTGQSAEVEGLLTGLKQMQHDAVILINDPVFLSQVDRVLTYCAERRLPSMFSTATWVVSGGLMSYEPQLGQMYRRAAAYVGRILAGAQPRDLPVEQPTMFSFTLNLKAAKTLGLTVPDSLLLLADRVIE